YRSAQSSITYSTATSPPDISARTSYSAHDTLSHSQLRSSEDRRASESITETSTMDRKRTSEESVLQESPVRAG
ncbi:hypothetical protein HDU93_007577, partial [Gonapodya sp. JEL0774]